MRHHHAHVRRDRGSILPLVLVMSFILGAIVVALTSYVATGLRFGNVVEERADRLAAADGGLRYALEELAKSKFAGCFTSLGDTGFKVNFPQQINESDVTVICRKAQSGIGDVNSWAVIVTGAGVPNGQPFVTSQSGGGIQKLLGGPVWVSDPGRIDFQADVQIDDGDIWYYNADCTSSAPGYPPHLSFTPAYRGFICVDKPWQQVYKVPPVNLPAATLASVNPTPDTTSYPGCSVFSPGTYTTVPSLTQHNYFKSGEYYFEDVDFKIENATVIAGWPDFNKYGDQRFLDTNSACQTAMQADQASGALSGATWYLGGSTRIYTGNKGALEILRRLQGNSTAGYSVISMQALEAANAPAGTKASTLGWNDNIVSTKAGNNTDIAFHGLVWAPYAQMEFGNTTNSANGQLLGGAAFSRILLQASASASAFIIRVEPSPSRYSLYVDATATKKGRSTTMRAVVLFNDQGVAVATNSWRVLES